MKLERFKNVRSSQDRRPVVAGDLRGSGYTLFFRFEDGVASGALMLNLINIWKRFEMSASGPGPFSIGHSSFLDKQGTRWSSYTLDYWHRPGKVMIDLNPDGGIENVSYRPRSVKIIGAHGSSAIGISLSREGEMVNLAQAIVRNYQRLGDSWMVHCTMLGRNSRQMTLLETIRFATTNAT